MIKMYVYDKKFGQPFIKYKIVNTDTSSILEEGKRKTYESIGKIYFKLTREHGDNNVKMLSH